MKHKHLYSLLDQSFTTVRVAFDNVPRKKDSALDALGIARSFAEADEINRTRGYVYKVPRAWGVEVQDSLIVLTNNGLSIVTVLHVDAEPDIDIDASYDYKWAVQKVSMDEFRDLTEREKRFQDTMLEVERVKQRESLVKSFMESLPEGSEARKLFEATTASLASPVSNVESASQPTE